MCGGAQFCFCLFAGLLLVLGRALGFGLHRLTFFGFVWCVGHLSLRLLLVLRISVAIASGWRRRQDLVQMLLRKELHTPQEQCKKGDSTFLFFFPEKYWKIPGVQSLYHRLLHWRPRHHRKLLTDVPVFWYKKVL